jgi:repressor LexA
MAEVTELPEREGDGLTVRQRRVLEVIRNSVDRRGYPPSLREIGEAVGLTSPSSVAHQLAALERKGYLRKDPTVRARSRSSPRTEAPRPRLSAACTGMPRLAELPGSTAGDARHRDRLG